MQKNKYHAYATATRTVAKTKQIVMLYDGAIRLVRQAEVAIREKRIEDRYNLLRKATEIITGLQACLDFEQGGDMAQVLHSFYSAVSGKIFSIHRTNSLATCEEVVSSLKQMRDAWQEIDQNTSGDAADGAGGGVILPHPVAAAPVEVPADIPLEQGLTLSA